MAISRSSAHLATSDALMRSLKRRWRGLLRYLLRNPIMIVGLLLLLSLVLFCGIGALTYDTTRASALSVLPGLPPDRTSPLGTDVAGRDLFAVLVVGTPLTLRIGVVAGLVGLCVGTVLGFIAAYYGGWVDTIIRGVVDIGLTVPGLLVMTLVAVSVQGHLSVNQMALVVALLAWLRPARTIRSQVLTLRERSYVDLARLSGMSSVEIIVQEMLPNLLPYLLASLVSAISAAMLSSIGLEALGLGSLSSTTLGMTLYWVIFHNALLLGMWWWFIPPIVVLIVLFVGLYCVSMGLDEFCNPRIRKAA